MSRDGRRWEEPASSYRSGYYDRGYCHGGEYSRPSEPPTRSFNYWRDDSAVPASYPPRRSYNTRESYNEQWRYDDRQQYAEGPYGGGRNSGPGRYVDDRPTRRDRSPPYQTASRQRHAGYTMPRHARPTSHVAGPPEPRPSLPPPSPPPALPDTTRTSPSRSKSSQPLKPSADYLEVSREPSMLSKDPASRKLIVLDLNGTLLIRSARSRSGPRLRAVRPRPYMQSFRDYLLCPETKEWLDTMVWSSAQPHSVNDMVDKVFGATKGELKAVWNRMSLGLSEAEYREWLWLSKDGMAVIRYVPDQKTLATKDLTKPWTLLAPASATDEHQSTLTHQVTHSAQTTLLLDDSPHKAALQPYNHVCIPEYDNTRKQRDLRSLLAVDEPENGKRDKKKKMKRVKMGACSTDQLEPGSSRTVHPSAESAEEPYDAILLAIIGILDAVRLQSNVAGWIRTGSLLAMQERLGEVGTLTAVSDVVVPTGNDAGCTSDPVMSSEQAHVQTKIWFDDSLVVAYWVARGRRALAELGIQVVHGVTA